MFLDNWFFERKRFTARIGKLEHKIRQLEGLLKEKGLIDAEDD